MRLKLFWKLGLTYLLLLLVALGAVYFYTGRVVERNFIRTSLEQLEALIRLAETRPPDVEDIDSLMDWTDWMAKSGARVTVIESNGVVLADSDEDPRRMENHADRPEVQESLRRGRGTANRYSETVERDLLYLAVRYDWGPRPPVILRVAVPLNRINEAVAEVRRPVGTVTIALLILVGVLSLLSSRTLTARIARLRELSKRVAEGDFRPAALDRAGDELTELAAAMNETASRLEASIRSLREERNQSATILSSMSEGVAVVGRDARILYLNRAFRRSLGLGGESWEEYRGLKLQDVVRETELVELTDQALEKKQRGEREITVGTKPPRQLVARAAPVSVETATGAVLVLLDVTEIHRLERVRRDFVANVSHELKTPLTAIQGFAETLLGGAVEEPANSRRFLEIIREHSVRLGRLTDDLLKLSRIESGKQEPKLHVLEVAALIEPVVETSRLKAAPKDIGITVDIPDHVPAVEADADWLSEVLQNLLDNAIQYTPEGGEIVVRAWASEDGVHLAVADNGIGIPVENQERIFERFYRVDPARSREVGGTGLGLAISKHLVESLGGRIELDSEEGKGSTFTIVLPLQPVPAPATR